MASLKLAELQGEYKRTIDSEHFVVKSALQMLMYVVFIRPKH